MVKDAGSWVKGNVRVCNGNKKEENDGITVEDGSKQENKELWDKLREKPEMTQVRILNRGCD